jgi:Fe-S cluster biogenesis protein NfuA
MMGACADCMMIDATLKDGIEMAIKEEVPSVKEVINLRD